MAEVKPQWPPTKIPDLPIVRGPFARPISGFLRARERGLGLRSGGRIVLQPLQKTLYIPATFGGRPEPVKAVRGAAERRLGWRLEAVRQIAT